jgi:hypothetical protein
MFLLSYLVGVKITVVYFCFLLYYILLFFTPLHFQTLFRQILWNFILIIPLLGGLFLGVITYLKEELGTLQKLTLLVSFLIFGISIVFTLMLVFS